MCLCACVYIDASMHVATSRPALPCYYSPAGARPLRHGVGLAREPPPVLLEIPPVLGPRQAACALQCHDAMPCSSMRRKSRGKSRRSPRTHTLDPSMANHADSHTHPEGRSRGQSRPSPAVSGAAPTPPRGWAGRSCGEDKGYIMLQCTHPSSCTRWPCNRTQARERGRRREKNVPDGVRVAPAGVPLVVVGHIDGEVDGDGLPPVPLPVAVGSEARVRPCMS